MKTSYERTQEIIKGTSASFCAAKWYNVSIWLGNGRTASCHHPLAHKIPDEELEADASALHNTSHKKKMRKMMLEGERPPECSYCWTAEDASKGKGIYSDRIYQSARYTEEELLALKDISWDKNVKPKTVEICFDNLCNLACSYCNSEFSSTWHKDISDNGPYENMETGGGKTYRQDGSIAMPFGNKNEGNIYVKRFFDWFPDIRESIDELRVSGGEPSRSPSFWKLLDICKDESFQFAVNSNLIMDDNRLNKLIQAGSKFKKFEIYTSAECMYKNQEFVRDGFEWETWEKNLLKAYRSENVDCVHIMMTISLLSIWTVDQFLQTIINWKKELNNPDGFYMSVNILRFPSFQSINMLPNDIKNTLADRIEKVLEPNTEWLKEWEQNHYRRLITYLRNVTKSYEDKDNYESKKRDLVSFLSQYEKRRNKPMSEYMPEEFNNWYSTLL